MRRLERGKGERGEEGREGGEAGRGRGGGRRVKATGAREFLRRNLLR